MNTENRERQNRLTLRLNDNELYILEQKTKISHMRDKSAFLRHLIVYGFVYDIDYSELREYTTQLGRISNNLNQIAKRMNATGNVYADDVREVKQLMQEVFRLQNKILAKQPYMKELPNKER